jgi:Zn-dependent peptidase ImmA (M78 family)
MPRPSRAERAASQLLEDLNVQDAPVPVAKIAEDLRIAVREEPFEGEMSGVLYRRDDGRIVIGVNETHADARKRFTIAHEIGHSKLHRDVLFVDGLVHRDLKSSQAVDPKEIEANAFAAELLMPREWVMREIAKLVPVGTSMNPAKVARELAQIFEVSEQAMGYRLVNLGITTSV